MKVPIHRWKERVTYGEGFNGKSAHWTFDGKPCWLGSGVKDKHGREIFEGDIIRHGFTDREDTAVVTFQNGAFYFAFYFGDKTYPEVSPKFASSFEVIGHVDD